MIDQFTRLRDGDRFWYQNQLPRPLQRFIDRQKLSVIIRRNTSIKVIQPDVFRVRAAGDHHYSKSNSKDLTLRVASPIRSGTFSLEVKLKSPVKKLKKSDFEVSNGNVMGISRLSNQHYFVTVRGSRRGPVSVGLLGNRISNIGKW